MGLQLSWTEGIFKSKFESVADCQHANNTNVSITTKEIHKVLVAQWSIFCLFIDEPRNQGRLAEDVNLKQDWLFF
jgi:hypothetical protein